MWNDEETFNGHNHMLPLSQPIEARYVKYKVTPARTLVVTEVQALDGFEFKPFDLRIALPDPAQNGKAPPNAGKSPNAKQWKEGELPTTIGKPLVRSKD
jgi:hypothetical protein